MERLIHEADLYSEYRKSFPMGELVSWARESLSVRVTRGQIVHIVFGSTDPAEASRAANRIAELFIEENLNLREKQAHNTTAFLEVELERTRVLLEEQETSVSEYRLRNAGSLPSQYETNFAAIAQLERQLDLNRTRTEDVELRRFLLKREENHSETGSATPASPQATRLEQLELELQSLKAQFTGKHPDVVRIEAEIAGIRNQETPAASTEESAGSSDPRITEDQDVEMATLNVELSGLESERLDLMNEIARYQRRLEATPRVEQELIGLTRDYENLRESYQSLLAKQIEARLSEELERNQQSEQFRILDRASPPSAPSYPNRFIFTAVGLMLGGGVGVGLMMLRNLLDDTFPDEDSLANAFPGVATVIAIPHLVPEPMQPSETGGLERKQSA